MPLRSWIGKEPVETTTLPTSAQRRVVTRYTLTNVNLDITVPPGHNWYPNVVSILAVNDGTVQDRTAQVIGLTKIGGATPLAFWATASQAFKASVTGLFSAFPGGNQTDEAFTGYAVSAASIPPVFFEGDIIRFFYSNAAAGDVVYVITDIMDVSK